MSCSFFVFMSRRPTRQQVTALKNKPGHLAWSQKPAGEMHTPDFEKPKYHAFILRTFPSRRGDADRAGKQPACQLRAAFFANYTGEKNKRMNKYPRLRHQLWASLPAKQHNAARVDFIQNSIRLTKSNALKLFSSCAIKANKVQQNTCNLTCVISLSYCCCRRGTSSTPDSQSFKTVQVTTCVKYWPIFNTSMLTHSVALAAYHSSCIQQAPILAYWNRQAVKITYAENIQLSP